MKNFNRILGFRTKSVNFNIFKRKLYTSYMKSNLLHYLALSIAFLSFGQNLSAQALSSQQIDSLVEKL